jgi:Asp-tRNA(Asn)/Glu-tRNA(Gln) amidotransferase B subunit
MKKKKTMAFCLNAVVQTSHLDISQGSLRCDLNVSVSLPESSIQGARCEVKNVNGFGHIEHAIGGLIFFPAQ